MEDELEGSPGFINWSKYSQMGSSIAKLLSSRPSYNLVNVEAIQKFFDESEVIHHFFFFSFV